MPSRSKFVGLAIAANPRRGFVLIAVLVVAVLAMALFGLWAKEAVREHRRLAGQQLRLQAGRPAGAGLQRALAQRAGNQEFSGETWSVPADQLGGTRAAEVHIRLAPVADAEADALRVEAVARFPVDTLDRAQITRQFDIPN